MKNGRKLQRSFYERDTLWVAKSLLGKFLVRKINNKKTLVGKIVETEAYIGPKDRASHSFGFKKTKRSITEYLEGGHIYIYLVYGMYWQLNITTSKKDKPECVLIRALEPEIKGKKSNLAKLKKLTNGPGKLCKWLKLDKSFNAEDLTKSKRIWIEDRKLKLKNNQIASTKRIGIDYAGPYWSNRNWRFYIKGNPFVSKK